MAYGNIKGITIEIDGDTSKLTTALRNVDKQARDTNRNLRDIKESLKYDKSKGPELAAQKQRELANAIKNSKEKLDILKQGQAEMTEEFKKTSEGSAAYDSLTREIWKTERQLKSFEAQSDRSYQKLAKVRDVATDFGKSAQELGGKMTKKLTVPLAGAAGAAGKMAIDFDTAMVGVRKTTDLTDEEFEAMRQTILDMSKEMPASATEIAGVAEAAGQLGIEKENIATFAKTVTDLGNATNMTAEEAATSFARFANITQLPQDQFGQLGSVVVDLGNNLATTESEIVDMGLRLAGAGTQVGLTQAEVLGLSGAMSSVGINAEAGGSAMSQVLSKMNSAVIGATVGMDEFEQSIGKTYGITASEFIKTMAAGGDEAKEMANKIGIPVKEAKKMARELDNSTSSLEGFGQVAGLSATEFAEVWKNEPTKAIELFIKGLGKVQESGGDVNGVLGELGIKGLREVDTLKRLSGAGDLLAESFGMANNAFDENNALSDEVARKYESIEAKLEILKNKFKAVAIEIGEQLIPYIEKATDFLGDFADKLSNADPEKLGLILGIGAFVAALGPVLMIIGKIAGVIGTVAGALGVLQGTMVGATPTMIGLSKAIGGIKSAFGALKGLLMAHPIAAIVIGALTIAIPLIVKNWDEIKEFLTNAWESIKEIASNVWTGIADFVGGIWEGVKEAWSEFWDPIGEWLGEKIQAMIDVIQPIVDTFVNVFKVAWMLIEEIFRTTWELISGFFRENWEAFVEMAKIIFTGLKDFFENIWNGIKDVVTSVWKAIKDFLKGIWQSIYDVAKPIFDKIKNFISNVWEGIKTITYNIWNGIKNTLSVIWNGIKAIATPIFEAIKNFISRIWEGIKTVTSNVWNRIKNILSTVWNTIYNVSKPIFDAIKNFISGIWNGIKTTTSNIWNGIKSTLSGIWNSIKGTASNIWNGVKASIEGPMNAAKNSATNIAHGIKNGVTGAWSGIKSTTSNVWNGIKNSITGPIETARDIVRNAIDNIISYFDVHLQFPHIKLPHFGISGGFSLDPPQVPHFTIDWYKKGAIFTKPTLFNTPFGMKGVGEAGAEAVLPIEKLSSIIAEALRQNQDTAPAGVTVTGNTFNVREESDIDKIARELYRLIESKKRGVGLG